MKEMIFMPNMPNQPTSLQLYNELLMAVERKFPDETRHQTALRYIREAEQRTRLAAEYVMRNEKEDK